MFFYCTTQVENYFKIDQAEFDKKFVKASDLEEQLAK